MMLHSADYLDLFSTVCRPWQWLLQAAVAKETLAKVPSAPSVAFYEGKVCAAEYWIKTELPRVELLASLCRSGEGSYARMNQAWSERDARSARCAGPDGDHSAAASFSVTSFRCKKTLCAIDIVGTARSAPGT